MVQEYITAKMSWILQYLQGQTQVSTNELWMKFLILKNVSLEEEKTSNNLRSKSII